MTPDGDEMVIEIDPGLGEDLEGCTGMETGVDIKIYFGITECSLVSMEMDYEIMIGMICGQEQFCGRSRNKSHQAQDQTNCYMGSKLIHLADRL